MFKIWLYKKAMEPNVLVDQAMALVPHDTCNECYIFTDSERDLISYQKLKKDMAANTGILIFLSLEDISTDAQTVLSEIDWFISQDIMLAVLDYPSTFNFTSLEINRAGIHVLQDCYRKISANNIKDIRLKQPLRGRKKLSYPENWTRLYQQWKNKEISAVDFMKMTKLKKGTFYHLVKDYETVMEHLVTIRKIV